MNMTNEQLTFVEESQNLRKQVRQKAFKKYFTQFKWPFVSVCFILLFVVCASYLYALYWGIITSLKDILDFNENMFGLPQRIKFTNYGTAFRKLYYTIQTPTGRVRIMFPNLLFNSIVFAVVMPTVSNFSCMFTAYAATKYKFGFNRVLHFCVVLGMVVPPVSSLGMSLQIAHTFGIYDNFLMIAFTTIGFAHGGFFIWAGVFKGISSEYMDAAKIDGANNFTILFKVMMPMARNSILVMWVLSFISYWNSYSTQYTMLPSMPNLALALWSFQFDVGNEVAWPPVQIAACMMCAIPCLILYFSFQKMFLGSITSGGLKG